MSTWVEDIVTALTNLGGVAKLKHIYIEVDKIRPSPDLEPKSFQATVRGTIECHSSDSLKYNGKDLFFSGNGIGKGVWGLRLLFIQTPKAVDIDEITNDDNDGVVNQDSHLGGNQFPDRKRQETYRILRDTKLAREIKLLNRHRCQLCDSSIILTDGKNYSEAHHIKPLGRPHNGPDIAGNIIVLCPNHHVMLDYGAIKLNSGDFKINNGHTISTEFIKYHNDKIFGAVDC